MGLSTGGGGGTDSVPSYKTEAGKLTKAIVVEDVQVIEKTLIVEVPKIVYVPTEQVKYVTSDEYQVKYITKEQGTVKYIPVEEKTVVYKTKEEETIKYVSKEVPCEKPILVEKIYEKPVIKEVELAVITIKDLAVIKEFASMVPLLVENIKELLVKMKEMKNYTLVEQEIKVPKVLYFPVEVERVVWKDVIKERPSVS